ncbi:MAG: TetR/AcrR family transcriptional repressor of multidrug resistance operon [Motiliproteus sp.]|jgi:TetR/AcrR family transcriptional repressor of multidrug resistance operon
MKLDLFKNFGDKRSRILEASGVLIAGQGFHGLSMAKLARLSGVATGTLYLYFDDKEDLIQQYYDEIHQAVAKQILDGFDDRMALSQQYRYLWLKIRDFLLHNPDHFSSKVQYEHSPYFNPQQQRLRMEQLFSPILQMLQQGVDTGVFKPLPIPLLMTLSLDLVPLLVQKHFRGYLLLDEAASEAAIEASWDALSLKH